MPITTGNIGLIPASSGSELTSSFDVLNVFFSSPTYGSVNPTASVASIKVNIIEFNNSGSAGELVFHTNSPENSGSVGDPVLTLFSTGSNNEPRVGIGFSGSEKPIKAFDIRSKIDNSVGTEILLRSSRTSEGAQAGDEAGLINFVIDSSSFNDITTTGSIATIKSIVDSVSATNGVAGRLVFGIQRNIDTAVDMLEMGYGGGSYADFYRSFTSRSFEIVDFNPLTTATQNASFTLSNGINPYVIIRTDNPGTGNQGGLVQLNDKFGTGSIFLHGPSGEITASSLTLDDSFQYNNVILESTESSISAGNTTLGEFPTASYKAIHIDYLIISGSSKARAGHLMSTWKGNSVTVTDTSAKSIGNTSDAEFSVVLNGANADLKITSSNSYDVSISSRAILNGSSFALGGGNISTSPFPFTGSATITGSLDITGSIIPGGDGVYDLGDATHFWRTASIEHIVTLGDTIEFRDKDNKNTKRGTLKLDAQGGLKVRGASNALTVVSASHGHFTGDMNIAGDLAINGIPNISASIASASASGGGSAEIEGISSSRINPDNIDAWLFENKQLLGVGSFSNSGGPKVSIGEGHPRDLFFHPNGTKLFIVGNGLDDISSVELTTAWDLLSYDNDTVETANLAGTSNAGGGGFEGNLYSLHIANDPTDTDTYGKKWFTTGNSRDEVQVYTSSVAWDVSTIDTNAAEYISTTDFTNNPYGVSFNPNGSKMYIIVANDTSNVDIGMYDLSTNWDVTTAVYNSGSSLNLTLTDSSGNTELYPRNMTFNSDGTMLYIAGDQREFLYQLELSTPYNVSTATQVKVISTAALDNNSFYGQTNQNFNTVSGVYYSEAGYFYLLFNANDQIIRFNRDPNQLTLSDEVINELSFKKSVAFEEQIIASGIISNGSNRFSGNMYINGQVNTGGLNSSGLYTANNFFLVRNTSNEDRRGILFSPSHAGWEQDSVNQGLMLKPDLATYLQGGKKTITLPGKSGTVMLDTDAHYLTRYNTNAQTYVENSGSLEFYYTARADGQGEYSKIKGAVAVSGQSLNRRIFYSDRAFAHPDSSSQWAEYTNGTGDISLDTTKNLAFDLLNFRDTGSIPLSFKSSVENHLQDSLHNTSSMGLAYGLRRLSHTHTGYAIQVENDSNVTLDIGFDNDGNLDTGSILTHIGSGEGYVTKWYDQSPNQNDAYYDSTYTYAGDKPKIATAGSIITDNNKPAIDTSVGGALVMTEEYSTGTSDFLMTIVANKTNTSNNAGMIIGTQVGNDNRFWLVSNYVNIQINGGSNNHSFASPNNVNFHTLDQQLFTMNHNGSTTTIDRNGIASTNSGYNRSGPFRATLLFNAWNNAAYEFKGKIQELIIFEQSSSKADIVSNINSYYSVY